MINLGATLTPAHACPSSVWLSQGRRQVPLGLTVVVTPPFLPALQMQDVNFSLSPILKHKLLEGRLHICFEPSQSPLGLVPSKVIPGPGGALGADTLRSSGQLPTTGAAWSRPDAHGAGCSGTGGQPQVKSPPSPLEYNPVISPILPRVSLGVQPLLPAPAPWALTFKHDGLAMAFLLLLSEELVAGRSAGHEQPKLLQEGSCQRRGSGRGA